jgi:uncharacterized membrane protein YqjE
MTPQDLPGGIPSRITRLTAGVLRYTLSLGALAAEEGRLLIRQSVTSVLLLVAMVVMSIISYVALIGAGVSLLAVKLSWGWPVSLTTAGLIHLGLVGILLGILRSRTAPRPFEATRAELCKDIDALGNYSTPSRRTP